MTGRRSASGIGWKTAVWTELFPPRMSKRKRGECTANSNNCKLNFSEEIIMEDKNTIAPDGSCPFTASSNLQIEVTSYDLELDRYLIRYGSTEGFKYRDLIAPFHAFLMNVGKDDIHWEISNEDGSTETINMGENHIFFNPANVAFSRSTNEHYEFILVLIDPDILFSSAKIPEKGFDIQQLYNVLHEKWGGGDGVINTAIF